jgi:hypothetical protein
MHGHLCCTLALACSSVVGVGLCLFREFHQLLEDGMLGCYLHFYTSTL